MSGVPPPDLTGTDTAAVVSAYRQGRALSRHEIV